MSGSHEKKEEEILIKKILVPIDGSINSLRSARYAIEVAKLQKAQIICINVIAKLPYDYIHESPAIVGPAVEVFFENMKNQAQVWFNQIIKMAENDGISNIKTDILVNVLSITDAIINYAIGNSIDLIVIGATGRTGIDRFLLGSVTSNIIKHAHCPVIVVR